MFKFVSKTVLVIAFFCAITGFVYFFPYRKPVRTVDYRSLPISDIKILQEATPIDIEERSDSSPLEGSSCSKCTVEKAEETVEVEENGECNVEDYVGDGFEVERKDGEIYVYLGPNAEEKHALRAVGYLTDAGCDVFGGEIKWIGR